MLITILILAVVLAVLASIVCYACCAVAGLGEDDWADEDFGE